jgi:hypothetical protein
MIIKIIGYFILILIFIKYYENFEFKYLNKNNINKKKLKKLNENKLKNILSKTNENKTNENKTNENKTNENKTNENKTNENKTNENKTNENKTNENKLKMLFSKNNNKIELFKVLSKDEEIRDHGVGVFPQFHINFNNKYYKKANKLNKNDYLNINKTPDKDKLELDEYDKYNNRIQSFSTDIIVKNKNKMIYELNNEVFNKEFKKLINKKFVEYIQDNLDYTKVKQNAFYNNYINFDKFIKKQNNNNKNNNKNKNKNKFLLVKTENLNNKEKSLYTKSKKLILNKINKIDNLKLNYKNVTEKIDNTFDIIQDDLDNVFKHKNKNEYIIEFDIVIYRDYKTHGKHLKCQVFIKNNNIYITSLEVIGIVSEDKLTMFKPINEYPNNLLKYKFNNKYVMTNLPREEEIYLMSEEDKATWFRTRLAKLRLDRGIHEDL